MTTEERERRWAKHPTGECDVKGCSGKHCARGKCAKHYYRMYRGQPVGPPESYYGQENDDPHPAQVASLARRSRQMLPAFARAVGRSGQHWRVDGTKLAVQDRGRSIKLWSAVLQGYIRRGWIRAKKGEGLYRVTAAGLTAIKERRDG